MISGHVWIGICNEIPDVKIFYFFLSTMARLVYPFRYQMNTLPANTVQHTYKLAKCFGAMSSLTPG